MHERKPHALVSLSRPGKKGILVELSTHQQQGWARRVLLRAVWLTHILKWSLKGLGRKCGETSLGCLKGLCGAGPRPWQPCLLDVLRKFHSEGTVGPEALVQCFQ